MNHKNNEPNQISYIVSYCGFNGKTGPQQVFTNMQDATKCVKKRIKECWAQHPCNVYEDEDKFLNRTVYKISTSFHHIYYFIDKVQPLEKE